MPEDVSPYTPSTSNGSPGSTIPDSPGHASSGEDDSKIYTELPYRSSGMVDGSRIILCVFMFAVLLFNPFR